MTELRLLAAKQPLFELQLIETASTGRLNLVQQLKENTKISLTHALYYLCGPAAMSRQYKDDLIQQGVPSDAVHAERFGLELAATQGPVKQALLIEQGKVTTIEAAAGVPLLQAAEQQGLSPRFGCRIGVCYQCVCQKNQDRY